MLKIRVMPTNNAFSECPLPPVHAAALELHLLSLNWLEHAECRATRIARICGTTERAVLAIELAAGNHRRKYQLRRARESMALCRGLFRLLYLERHIRARVYDEARRRIEQILAALDRIGERPTEGMTSPLPALEAAVSDEQAHPVLGPLLHLLSVIEAVSRSLQEAPSKDDGPPCGEPAAAA